jgi:hypothetical protein
MLNEDDLKLFNRLIKIAGAISDGHVSVLKFTGSWRVAFGTPNSHMDIEKMWYGRTFAQAAQALLNDLGKFLDIQATEEEESAWHSDIELPVFNRGFKAGERIQQDFRRLREFCEGSARKDK